MDKRQKKAVDQYKELIRKSDNLAATVGRSVNELGKANDISLDIEKKLELSRGNSLLEIGCGYGELTKYMLNLYNKYKLNVTMLDIEPVITAIEENLTSQLNSNIKLMSGVFPYETKLKNTIENKFDYIIVYSVIHYTDNPEEFVMNCLNYLAPSGKLLIADLPNINKRGRFVSTEFGRKFEAEWKNVSLSDVKIYSNHKEFVETASHNTPQINDKFVTWVFTELRELGFHVFVLPQNENLPYHYTREDILVIKPPK
jgi:SAM-dependent methyltransferase